MTLGSDFVEIRAMNQSNDIARVALPTSSELAKGLSPIGRFRMACSLALPFIWSGLYFVCACWGCWAVAVFCLVALSFVTYGSVSHDLVHGNLGLNKRVNAMLLTLIELLAVRSGHAYRAAHLHHHARFPHDDDVEGAAAGMSLGWALLEGVAFQWRIYGWAWQHAERDRGLIRLEGLVCGLLVLISLISLPYTPIPFVYVALMTMGTWVIPLATSYVPHVRNGADELHRTRRFRGKVASLLALEHLYHLEHHLYPAIPHHQWPALARRLDPYFDAAGVAPVKFWF
jgi:beta-carotene hydroxylase